MELSVSKVVVIRVSWVFMLFIIQDSPFETEKRVNLLEEIGVNIRIHLMLCLFPWRSYDFPNIPTYLNKFWSTIDARQVTNDTSAKKSIPASYTTNQPSTCHPAHLPRSRTLLLSQIKLSKLSGIDRPTEDLQPSPPTQPQ
jgi:hypothetical protein